MGREIERKFLVKPGCWLPEGPGARLRQGYLCSGEGRTVRVRTDGTSAWLTVKGPTTGITRAEFEYPIPCEDADYMLDHLCAGAIIDKHRHREVHLGKTWEIDVFHGDNDGLVLAEVELASEDESVDLPGWAGEDVSLDRRYANASLAWKPFRGWGQ